MKKINLAITGCMGRMGKQIIKSARSDKNFKIVTLTENRIIKNKINGIKPSLNTNEAIKKANLIIDFSVPKCTFEILKFELDDKNPGSTNINTNIIAIAGIICSKFIFIIF